MRRSAAPSSMPSKRPRFQTPFTHNLGNKTEFSEREEENASLNTRAQDPVVESSAESSQSRLQEVLSKIRKVPSVTQVQNVSIIETLYLVMLIW